MATLTAIERRGRSSKRRTLCLDEERWRPVSSDVLRELHLHVDDIVDPDELLQLIGEAEPRVARDRALRLLAYRERSRHEVRTRLLDDGYPEEVVNGVVSALVSTGLIDDSRLTEVLARELIAIRGLGQLRAMRVMTRRGIDDAAALAALTAASPADETSRAGDAARRLAKPSDTVERLAARVARRGFAPRDAFSAARAVLGSDNSSDDSSDPFE